MKKTITVLLVLILVFVFAGCNKTEIANAEAVAAETETAAQNESEVEEVPVEEEKEEPFPIEGVWEYEGAECCMLITADGKITTGSLNVSTTSSSSSSSISVDNVTTFSNSSSSSQTSYSIDKFYATWTIKDGYFYYNGVAPYEMVEEDGKYQLKSINDSSVVYTKTDAKTIEEFLEPLMK